jgi:hypothetical protein
MPASRLSTGPALTSKSEGISLRVVSLSAENHGTARVPCEGVSGIYIKNTQK